MKLILAVLVLKELLTRKNEAALPGNFLLKLIDLGVVRSHSIQQIYITQDKGIVGV